MTVYFRVDSSEAIGSGHVMRCLTLADRIKNNNVNEKIIFLSKPHFKNIISVIKQRGFDVRILSEPKSKGAIDEKTWLGTSQEHDSQEVIAVIEGDTENPKTLIIDHYSLDIEWEKRVRLYVDKIIVIDDLANRKHDCDILLDQNFYLDKETRYQGLVPEHAQLLLGCEYALLRPEFYDYTKNYVFKAKIKNIFVFFGGIDAAGMTLRTIQILKDYPYIHAHIVSSEHCADWQRLSDICAEAPYFTLYKNVDNMAQLMASCDVAIGAGGTTQWERACIGIPSLVVSIADNQTHICQDTAETGYCYYAGKCQDMSQETYSIMLESFILNPYLRKNIFNITKKIKFSASFVSCFFYSNNIVNIRHATKNDAENLFYWRNHANNRIHSHSSQEFSMQNHLEWFESVINNKNQHLYIVSDNHKDIGVVRFDEKDTHNLVSIYLVPDTHKKGYGKMVLKTAEDYFALSVKNNKPFYAEILSNNKSSIKLFENLGYTLDKQYYIKSFCSQETEEAL